MISFTFVTTLHGFVVIMRNSTQEAFKYLEKTENMIHAIICDFEVGDMHWAKMLDYTRRTEQYRGVPILSTYKILLCLDSHI